jgi:hypothetical protein
VNFRAFKNLRLAKFFLNHSAVVWPSSLCLLCVLCVSVVNVTRATLTRETQRTQSFHRDTLTLAGSPQGPELDYSNFKHTSQRHASLTCTTCHQRSDNSAMPRFPGHKACTGCHLAEFVTPAVPMCAICHTDVSSGNPQLRSFPTKFNESFNMKFDHAQHMTGPARPLSGCAACHGRLGGRAAALAIPSGIAAHNQCYSCHTPSSKSLSGKEIASCGVCHEQKPYARTATNARAFRFAFSHAKHGPAQRLACADCHGITAGASQSRQVSSPAPAEHFLSTRGPACLSCHNGKRSFGGDLAFKDCRRCHTSASFKMPL